MAVPTEIPFNIGNMTFTNLTLDIPRNITQFLAILPSQAATQSQFWFTTISLILMTFIQYFAFADRSKFARFNYSDGRAISLCFATTGCIGVFGIEFGFFMSFQPVAACVILFMAAAIFVKAYEDKE